MNKEKRFALCECGRGIDCSLLLPAVSFRPGCSLLRVEKRKQAFLPPLAPGRFRFSGARPELYEEVTEH